MGSLSGILQRPVLAVSALAIASVSADCYYKLVPFKSSDACSSFVQPNPSPSPHSLEPNCSWVSQISMSKLAQLSFISKICIPLPNLRIPIFSSNHSFMLSSSVVLLNSYQSADLAKTAKPAAYPHNKPSLPSDILYRWHLPDPSTVNIDVSGKSRCSSAKSRTVVVLLGWLGAKQKHLNRYAEWYTSRGFHVITFTFPLSDVVGYTFGWKAEKDVELLVNHLAEWLEEENGKNMVFHTFSNTGWLTYGVILEKFHNKDSSLMGTIRGCIVDSAPVDIPDPQVFASGFSAAFLKKKSIATKGSVLEPVGIRTSIELKPALTEAALLVVLEKLFGLLLNHPSINRRLSEVVGRLKFEQPSYPELYIYSSADRVVPACYVESFVEAQRKNGRNVRACNFITTPHVDHFRHDPNLYSSQLTHFLEDCVLSCCKSNTSLTNN